MPTKTARKRKPVKFETIAELAQQVKRAASKVAKRAQRPQKIDEEHSPLTREQQHLAARWNLPHVITRLSAGKPGDTTKILQILEEDLEPFKDTESPTHPGDLARNSDDWTWLLIFCQKIGLVISFQYAAEGAPAMQHGSPDPARIHDHWQTHLCVALPNKG